MLFDVKSNLHFLSFLVVLHFIIQMKQNTLKGFVMYVIKMNWNENEETRKRKKLENETTCFESNRFYSIWIGSYSISKQLYSLTHHFFTYRKEQTDEVRNASSMLLGHSPSSTPRRRKQRWGRVRGKFGKNWNQDRQLPRRTTVALVQNG